MSFLFKKVAAQDLSGNVIVVKHGNIWNIESPNEPHRKLIGSNFLSRAEAEKTAKEVGYSVSGVYEDSRKNGIAEYVKAQDGVPTKFVGICRNGAKYYTTATSFEQAKKELTEKAKNEGREIINVRVAEDAAEFKVGDKVKHTQYGTIGKVFEIDPAGNVGVQWNNGQAYYGKTAKPLSLIIAADSAAMDDLNDGIKTIENKARALIADAKNARSKYAEILARSEIAKNNAQVKKTFEDDIARCDKLINALKAI